MANLELPWDRYLIALERLKKLIESGEPLVYWDCTAIGAKETHCSWGLGSSDAKMWPDPVDHLWPDEFLSRGRVAPLYRQEDQMCPFDRRTEGSPLGCFYRCRLRVPDRSEAITLVGDTITLVKNKWMNRVRGAEERFVLKRGDQSAYIPQHLWSGDTISEDDLTKPGVELGFVTSLSNTKDAAFCRYWSPHHDGLRTTTCSELTPVRFLLRHNSHDQGRIDTILRGIL